jgi:hypothetical protein
MSFVLSSHPFAVEAFFEEALVVTFAYPKEHVQHLIPHRLELDTFNNKWAFIAVALVQTKDLRPKGFPNIWGNDFFLIGYRVFVRFRNRAGKSLRGLYILKSETDKKKMTFMGNLFTKYNYTTTDILKTKTGKITDISSRQSRFRIVVEEIEDDIPLPTGSPFSNWKEARRFAGPLPFTFTYNPADSTILVIEGVRQAWNPKPLRVLQYDFDFINKLEQHGTKLANAFMISNIPYFWKKGRFEK